MKILVVGNTWYFKKVILLKNNGGVYAPIFSKHDFYYSTIRNNNNPSKTYTFLIDYFKFKFFNVLYIFFKYYVRLGYSVGYAYVYIISYIF